ncbi:MAG: hypothetical protein EOO38_05810 [Cytophagaceae bacterium]|nr:MAG: hypothetical protein EOO38_05810 [Cytophagaceae bacterium]
MTFAGVMADIALRLSRGDLTYVPKKALSSSTVLLKALSDNKTAYAKLAGLLRQTQQIRDTTQKLRNLSDYVAAGDDPNGSIISSWKFRAVLDQTSAWLLAQPDAIFPVDYLGTDQGHTTIMRLNKDSGQASLQWYESNGENSFYKLKAHLADKLRTHGRGTKVHNEQVHGVKWNTRSRPPKGRMLKVGYEMKGRVEIKTQFPGVQSHRNAPDEAWLNAEEVAAIDEINLSAFLALDLSAVSNGCETCDDLTALLKRLLDDVGVSLPASPQRLQAVQRSGTCELKSLMGVVSHDPDLSEVGYQIFRVALSTWALSRCQLITNDQWCRCSFQLSDKDIKELGFEDKIASHAELMGALKNRVDAALELHYHAAVQKLITELTED